MKKLLKKRIIKLFILAVIVIIAFWIVNRLIPIEDVTDKTISISLSTTKPTASSVKATIKTTTKHSIFYYIDYKDEEEFYEEEFSTNDSDTFTENNTNNDTNISTQDPTSSLEIKNIPDKDYKEVENSTIEIEKNGVVYLKYERLGKLSSVPYVFPIDNIDKSGPEIGEIETTSTDSSITVTVNTKDYNSNYIYYFRLDSSNSYICTDSSNTYTFTELITDESYTIYVKVADEFGNETEAVTDAIASSTYQPVEKKIYHFKVNLATNTVTVYDKDENGKYTTPVKAMICSTGKSTPKSGTYKTSASYRWLTLFGGVYGQYAVRIHGNILFHSVPYTQMYPDTLEYEEYDKLGTAASAGCVRLTVRDSKWIYDNAKIGSTVEFYSDSKDPGPLGKPSAQKISSNKENRNWDPTDPDTRNPWKGGSGKVVKSNKNSNMNSSSSSNGNYIANRINKNTTNSSNTTNTTNTSNTIIWNTID